VKGVRFPAQKILVTFFLWKVVFFFSCRHTSPNSTPPYNNTFKKISLSLRRGSSAPNEPPGSGWCRLLTVIIAERIWSETIKTYDNNHKWYVTQASLDTTLLTRHSYTCTRMTMTFDPGLDFENLIISSPKCKYNYLCKFCSNPINGSWAISTVTAVWPWPLIPRSWNPLNNLHSNDD